MTLPTKTEARTILHSYVSDSYQRHHAEMVAACMEGYALLENENSNLWWLTGYFHDIDYERYPTEHPGPSLVLFTDWQYPHELIHAIEAHAYGFNGFTTTPETKLAKTLVACDEICGIFYAYQKLNSIPYGDMKLSSIKKRLSESKFAPGINREHIYTAVTNLNITIDEHITHLISFLKDIPPLKQ